MKSPLRVVAPTDRIPDFATIRMSVFGRTRRRHCNVAARARIAHQIRSNPGNAAWRGGSATDGDAGASSVLAATGATAWSVATVACPSALASAAEASGADVAGAPVSFNWVSIERTPLSMFCAACDTDDSSSRAAVCTSLCSLRNSSSSISRLMSDLTSLT